ncbi:MAG: ACP S-malonyltransferase [Gammaproteobacteria bacterium]|jgi:[acyl-carrier-protein] S-malonyltransferase
MQKNLAIVFPGQGSQKVGMLTQFAEKYSLVAENFARASQVLGYDLWEIVVQGPAEKLNQTIYTQPAMLVADVTMWQIWQEQNNDRPVLMAGHSLGEYAALVAASAIDFSDAVSLVSKRAHFMQDAVLPGDGVMVVILGLTAREVVKVCGEVSGEQVVQAVNFNSPQQVVIAGHTQACERAMSAAKEAGAKIVKKLPVSVPAHSLLMKPAAEQFAEYLQNIEIQSPKISVINNVDVKINHDPEEIRSALVRQLYNPVRWVETIEFMVKQGVDTIIECGPGKVLMGLNKRINTNVKHLSCRDVSFT